MDKIERLSRDKSITNLYAEGLGCRRIGRILHMAPASVYKRLCKMGINRSYAESPGGSVPWADLTTQRRARNRLRSKVAKGLVEKLPCFICGKTKTEGHHWDYAKPLDVFWLCRQHHVDVHFGKIELPLPNEPEIPAGPWGNTGKFKHLKAA